MFEYMIKDGFVVRREVSREDKILLEDFIPAMTTYIPVEICPLPTGTKYIRMLPGSSDDRVTMHLITEDQPQNRDIMFNRASFKISLPFERFWFVVEGRKVFERGQSKVVYTAQSWGYLWASMPMANANSVAVRGYLPNVYPESNVCFGSNHINSQQPFGHYIDSLKNVFWTSSFNHDLSYDWAYPTFEEWETATTANPNVWSTWSHIWALQTPMTEIIGDGIFRPTLPDGPGEPIPPVRPVPTFANIENWWTQLSEDAQRRFRIVAGLQND